MRQVGKHITAILAAAVLVAGFFALSPGLFNYTEAEPTKPVIVVNPQTSPVPVSLANLPTVFQSFCPPKLVEHWDKIIFKVPVPISGTPTTANEPLPPLVPDRTYDIKVLDDPNSVADVNQKVWDFLKAHGYILVDPNGEVIPPEKIVIVDVEYAITCTLPGTTG